MKLAIIFLISSIAVINVHASAPASKSKGSAAYLSAVADKESSEQNQPKWTQDHQHIYIPMMAALTDHNDNDKFENAKLLITFTQMRTDLKTGKHPQLGKTLLEMATDISRIYEFEKNQPTKWKKLTSLLQLDKRIASPEDFIKALSTNE